MSCLYLVIIFPIYPENAINCLSFGSNHVVKKLHVLRAIRSFESAPKFRQFKLKYSPNNQMVNVLPRFKIKSSIYNKRYSIYHSFYLCAATHHGHRFATKFVRYVQVLCRQHKHGISNEQSYIDPKNIIGVKPSTKAFCQDSHNQNAAT